MTDLQNTARSLDFNALGDRMKKFEKDFSSKKLMPGIPIIMRLDGRAFHTFAKGLAKPFEPGLTASFEATAKALIREFNADLAYHQSDEISLFWFNDDTESTLLFDGRMDKWLSVIASTASVKFNWNLSQLLPNKWKGLPVFDARVWQIPRWDVGYDYFTWRQLDARKNSVSMAASTVYSDKELHKKRSREKIEMLAEKGIDFYAYPEEFRQGVFFRKMRRLITISEEAWLNIPEKHRPESRDVIRNEVCKVEGIGLLSKRGPSGSFKLFHEGNL